MPTSNSFTVDFGAQVQVLTTECFLAEAFDPSAPPPHPPVTQFRAIWDTGATSTCITKDVAVRLGLVPTGMIEMHGVHGCERVPTYLVNIALPNTVGFVGLAVSQCTLLAGADVLIGMDIIGRGDFAVSRKGGHTVMSYRHPASKTIDFVVEHSSDQLKEQTRALIKSRPAASRKKRKKGKGH